MSSAPGTWWPSGYELRGPAPDGSGWRGVEVATGDPVVLRHVADGDRAVAARLVAFRHRRMVPVRAVLSGTRGLVVVTEAVGEPLAGRRLPLPTVVTAARDVAAALAAAHARRLCHGRVGPQSLTLVDGQVLLDGFGVGALLGTATAADDVAAVRELCGSLLGGPVPPELAAALSAPDAASLATALGRLPMLPLPAGDPRRWRLAAGAAAVAVLAVAAGGGWAWGRADAGPPPVSVAPAPVDLRGAVVTALRARTAALTTADARRLDEVYVTGTELHGRESAVVAELRRQRARAVGLVHSVLDVTVLRQDPSAASLRLVDELSGYDVVGPGGAVLRAEPSRGARAWRLELQETPAGWRIAAVTPV